MRYRRYQGHRIDCSLSTTKVVHLRVYIVDISDIVSISSRKCTQLKRSVFNVDIVDIVSISICIWTKLNLSISNVDTVSLSIFFCLQLKLTIIYVYFIFILMHLNTTKTHHILTSISSIPTIFKSCPYLLSNADIDGIVSVSCICRERNYVL